MKRDKKLSIMESMKRYDDEFKKEVIRKFMGGASIAGLSRETGIGEQTLHKWKNELVRTDRARWTRRNSRCESGYGI